MRYGAGARAASRYDHSFTEMMPTNALEQGFYDNANSVAGDVYFLCGSASGKEIDAAPAQIDLFMTFTRIVQQYFFQKFVHFGAVPALARKMLQLRAISTSQHLMPMCLSAFLHSYFFHVHCQFTIDCLRHRIGISYKV
jgi:hypothetical protein